MPQDSKNKTPIIQEEATISKKVLMSIIELAVRESTDLAELSGKRVKIKYSDKLIYVHIYVDVEGRGCCTDIVFLVQEEVKRRLEQAATAYVVGKVNVHVVGLLGNG